MLAFPTFAISSAVRLQQAKTSDFYLFLKMLNFICFSLINFSDSSVSYLSFA